MSEKLFAQYNGSAETEQFDGPTCALHVHKDMTDAIDLQKIATEFIGDSEHRLKIFGKP